MARGYECCLKRKYCSFKRLNAEIGLLTKLSTVVIVAGMATNAAILWLRFHMANIRTVAKPKKSQSSSIISKN
jgi:hypothetical protein